MKNKPMITALILLGMLCMPLFANATLLNRGVDSLGNRLIYDDDLNVTWYDYTKNLDLWQKQVNWASALVVDFGGINFSDWRLPDTVNRQGATGYNNNDSEMGHLFYNELAKTAGEAIGNADPFLNLLPVMYWSATEYSPYTNYAYWFGFNNGSQGTHLKNDVLMWGIAVRNGDVILRQSVPEPGVLFLIALGLAGMMTVRINRHRATDKYFFA